MNLYDKIKVGFGPGFGRKALKLFSLKPVDGSGDFSVVRANDTATEIGSDKLIKTVLANVPRADFEDFNCNTLLTEPSRVNIYLNSAILVTQGVTTSANTYTVSFYGLGSIDFSGAFVGGLAGTGENERVSLTFSSLGGALTTTVFGGVTNAQCELGGYPTSYIPTLGVALTRPQDVVSDGGDANSIDSTKGIVFCHASAIDSSGNKEITLSDGSEPNAVMVAFSASGITATVKIAGVSNGVLAYVIEVTDFNKIAYGYEDSNFVLWVNGLKVGDTNVGSVFLVGVLDRLNLDAGDGTTPFNGKTKELWYSDDLSINLESYTGFDDWNDLVSNFKYNSQ